MITVEQPLHVAILVSDLPQAEAFYGTVLGLAAADRPLGFPGAWYQVGTFQIHLIVAGGEPDVDHQPPDLASKWGRKAHMAFSVSNLEAAEAALRAAECPVQASASGRAALFTQDPDGNIIELSQL